MWDLRDRVLYFFCQYCDAMGGGVREGCGCSLVCQDWARVGGVD